ncbi:MAG: recombinase family protein, partial [Paracoccus sp. (in: a-proteobacteria)]|nr:recombinase family protein [Paracoccus sp. (in: a-proteobacteria)]
HEWTASKPERVARALAAAGRLRDAGRTHKAIAQAMNDEGIPSATGKPWTADSVRKLLGAAPD